MGVECERVRRIKMKRKSEEGIEIHFIMANPFPFAAKAKAGDFCVEEIHNKRKHASFHAREGGWRSFMRF